MTGDSVTLRWTAVLGLVCFGCGTATAPPTAQATAQSGQQAAPIAQTPAASATFDLEEIRAYRENWGVFRDRRPDLDGPVQTLDGADR